MSVEVLHQRLAEVQAEAEAALALVDTEPRLHQEKARFVGKSGVLQELNRGMRDVDASERPAYGKILNEAREALEAIVERHLVRVRGAARAAQLAAGALDLTRPGRLPLRGAVHPLRAVERRMLRVFADMGYEVAIGPQVETDFHNFSALNFPDDHPARDMQDTFHLEDGRILRTHTSPVQVRTMLANKPPIRIAAPGSVFRSDTPDMTHSPNFHQVEGLVVDKGVTMAQLKGTLQTFASRLFERELHVRFRPSFFPFTEPSVEVDVECPFCSSGCRVCKGSRWIEILGAGMVDPEVFRSAGIDPDVYTGFAFGIGIERVAMLLYGVEDMRAFYENDVRFLAQFR